MSNLLSIQRDLFREAPVAHRIYTHFDNFGYHLPFLHPTGEFGLEYEQCAKTLGDTRNVVGTQDALLHNLAQTFFAGLNFVGGELKLSYKDKLMTPRGDKGEVLHLIRIDHLRFQFAHCKHYQSASDGRSNSGMLNWNTPLAETAAKEENTTHMYISSSTSSAVSKKVPNSYAPRAHGAPRKSG